VLAASLDRLDERLADDDLLLDVGGWAKPLARADYVVDLMPWETRGLYGRDGAQAEERFTRDTWIQLDLCAREPWPFDDGQFDFVVCSHTLEDVRDPVWVCGQLERIAKAGYIEVPSRLEELSYGVQGPWVGWGHHHWLSEVDGERISFVFKTHVVHREGSHFPEGFHERLSPEERVETMWWEDSFEYREHIFYEPPELDGWLEHFVARNLEQRQGPRLSRALPARLRRTPR
jgi:Methyltransferase domain